MALVVLKQLLPADLPVIQLSRSSKKSLKVLLIFQSAALGVHAVWKLLRWLALSGDSRHPVIKFLHGIIRRYLNHGCMIRSEFNTRLPWQFLVIFPSRHVIVNYGSYGTVPLAILDFKEKLVRSTEECPDMFFRVTLRQKYEESRQIVAKAVGCDLANFVFVENITDGMNCVLRSLLPTLQKSDALLVTSIGYSSVLKMAAYYTKKYDRQLLSMEVTFPIKSIDAICGQFDEMLEKNKHVKMAIFDHITSSSALVMPVKMLSDICRKHGVLSVVDGAHAPGQLPLNVEDIGADVYMGNLHKWYFAPKSTALMYINPAIQDKMDPSLVSHLIFEGLHNRFFKQGTKDYTAHLAAGQAVLYMEKLGGLAHMHEHVTPMVQWAVELYKRVWNTEELDVPASMKAPYMRIVYLPQIFTQHYGSSSADGDRMIVDVLREFHIVMFVQPVQGRLATRVSCQIFSSKAEYVYAAHKIKAYADKLSSQRINS